MKKTFKTLSVMALAGLVMLGSCKKNEENNSTNGEAMLRAGIEQLNNNSKTELLPDGTINWTAGDTIMVNYNGNSTEFVLASGEGTTEGVFNGPTTFFGDIDMTTVEVMAAFPASSVNRIQGNRVYFDIPQEQTPAAGNIMMACGYAEDLHFSNVLGGVMVTLQGNGSAKTVNKLVLTSNNTNDKLWGSYFIAYGDEILTYVDGGSNSVTVNLPDVTLADGQTYTTYVMVPAGTLGSGFSIEIRYNNLSLKSANTGTTIEGTWGNQAIVMNTVYTGITYNYPGDVVTSGTTNFTPTSQEELTVLVSQIEAGSYTGDVTIGDDTDVFDFGGVEMPTNSQVVVSGEADATINNLTVSTTTAAPAMVIESGATVELNNVSLTSTSTASDSRAINVVGTDTEVTLVDCTIDGGNAGYSRGLNVYDGNATINVSGGSIHAGHYAVNIPSSGNGVTINLSDASIASGWAALNVWGENNTINATNCILRGTNDKTYNADGWNDFATVAFNNNNVNSAVNLVGCQIIAESTTGNKQYAIRMYTGNNTISIDNACTISKGVGNPSTPNWYAYYSGSNTTGSNWEIDDATFEAFNAAWGLSKSVNSKPATFQAPYVLNDKSSEN